MNTARRLAHQQGFTIVEFMIAGMLGLLMLAGIIQLFLGSHQSFRLQDAMANANDGGRFALQMLTEDIQRAGWNDLENGTAPNVAFSLPIPFDPNPAVCQANGASCEGGAATDSASISTHSDRIQIRYHGTLDCLGAEVNGGALGIVTNTYFAGNFTAQDDGVVLGELRCRGANDQEQPLLSNVESFQVLYGIDANGDGTPENYLDAAAVTAAMRSGIITVKVALVIASEPGVLDQARDSALDGSKLQLLGEANIVRKDKRLRRVFEKTILIPNRPE